MLDRLTIRAKLFSLSTTGSVFMLTLSALGGWAIQTHYATFEASNHTIKTLQTITSTHSIRQLIRSDISNILLLSPVTETSLPQKKQFISLLDNHSIALQRAYEKTQQLLLLPQENAAEITTATQATQQALDDFLKEAKKTVTTLNNGNDVNPSDSISKLMRSLEKFDDEFNTLDSFLLQKHSHFQQENKAFLHRSTLILGVTTCIFLVMLLLFTQRCSSNILRRLSMANDQIQRIIHGDLRQTVANTHPDEIGHLLNSLQTLQKHLSQTFRTLFDNSRRVLHGAETFRTIMGEITDSSTVQAESSEHIALSAQELTSNVSSILRQTEGSHGSISEASHICEHSLSAMSNALSEMNQIVSVVERASTQIQELQSSSSQISEIAQVIKEIADQTSLLALNAAIEAARAGEQGRGFAVVADEVRKLSERTAESTIQITAMIEAIMIGISEAVSTMQTGSEHVHKGVQVTQNAQEAMSDISNINQNMIELFQNIHSTLSQQSSFTQLMTNNISSIASLAEKNKVATQDAYTSVDRLQELANDLKNTTDTFQLG
ncbi:MAG: methyl-accepting chemotaxis protein [Pseudomonadota bacterium]